MQLSSDAPRSETPIPLEGIAVVIPAFMPSADLPELVVALNLNHVQAVVVVDDGSGPEFAGIFATCESTGAIVLRHAMNLGKGAALKTAFNYVLCHRPDLIGVVTADADGQHHPDDVLKVARRLRDFRDSIVMGVREFGSAVPFRSRIGNVLSRQIFRIFVGQLLTDTQTGLRGIPLGMLSDLLKIRSMGYEFELDMLIACKHMNRPIVEEKIRTIYTNGNAGSHFNPVRDSMRVSLVLFRFTVLSLATSLVDNLVFAFCFSTFGMIWQSQVAARLVAMTLNYPVARRAVFLSKHSHKKVLPRYLVLVFCSGSLSYMGIRLLSETAGVPVISAKVIVELLLFWMNFIILRDFIFVASQPSPAATDWDAYYRSTPITARLTRKYTQRVLLRALTQHAGLAHARPSTLVEIGGANSCFLNRILRELRPKEYHVIDSNAFGLKMLRSRVTDDSVVVHHADIRTLHADLRAEVVFSVGLIEHFSAAETRLVIQKHLDLAAPGGHAIISYPTPTILYRIARQIAELLGVWRFYDERPLDRSEVDAAVRPAGQVILERVLWPIVFTQRMIVIQKRPEF